MLPLTPTPYVKIVPHNQIKEESDLSLLLSEELMTFYLFCWRPANDWSDRLRLSDLGFWVNIKNQISSLHWPSY